MRAVAVVDVVDAADAVVVAVGCCRSTVCESEGSWRQRQLANHVTLQRRRRQQHWTGCQSGEGCTAAAVVVVAGYESDGAGGCAGEGEGPGQEGRGQQEKEEGEW